MIRIEDLDVGRNVAGCAQRQLRDLEQIGIDWDGPPLVQSANHRQQMTALKQLVDQGRTYPCFCSRADIRQAASAPHDPGSELRYPGTCRSLAPDVVAERLERDVPHCIRLRSDRSERAFRDVVLGELRGTVDDVVLMRRDGVIAYNLAVVVDDASRGVELVVRGADLAQATPPQLELIELLDLVVPRYAHVPVLLAPDGARLAKRHGSVTLGDRVALGETPAAVRGMLAASVGLALPAEQPTMHELLQRFDPELLPREPTTFPA